MKTQIRDLLVLVDESEAAAEALSNLIFLPPYRVRHLTTAPDPEENTEEPLVYLIGHAPNLADSGSLLEWMNRLQEAECAPAALLLPREGNAWCAATGHPLFCGLLPYRPQIPIGAMERLLREARRILAGHWGQHALRRADLAWSFDTVEAADAEQVWLLLESSLCGLIGAHMDFSCLGMAVTEALTNAVEHGNLGMDSALKDTTDDGIARFFEERERRLQNPAYSRRRVRVTAEVQGNVVCVRISNEGRGFDPAGLAHCADERPSRPLSSGFGLAMIESLVDEISVSADGRTISLSRILPSTHLAVRDEEMRLPTTGVKPAGRPAGAAGGRKLGLTLAPLKSGHDQAGSDEPNERAA